jgi:hypothetical protein
MNIIYHALTLPAIPHYPFSPPRGVMVTNVCLFLSHDRSTCFDILKKINHDLIVELITLSNCSCVATEILNLIYFHIIYAHQGM